MGNPSSAASVLGTWKPRALHERSSSKNTKYRDYYSQIGCTFVPLVVSTFGVMHDDFVRLLWLLAHPPSVTTLSQSASRIREAGSSAPLRHLLFAKLRARVAVAAAYAAAMHLDCIALDGGSDLPSAANYSGRS